MTKLLQQSSLRRHLARPLEENVSTRKDMNRFVNALMASGI